MSGQRKSRDNTNLRPRNLMAVLGLFMVTVVAMPLWAASAEDERLAKLIEGAKKEGRLTLYTMMSVPESTVMIKKFEEKYPFLKVDFIRLSAARLLAVYLAETNAKVYKADVICVQGFPFHLMKKRGLFQKYMSPQSQAYPEGARDPDGYGTSIYLNTKVIAYNKRLVAAKDVPASYEDLLDPKWKGKKFSVDTDNYEWLGNLLKIMGRAKGLELVKKLSLQQPKVVTGSTLRATLLAAGEFAVTVPVNGDGVERLKTQGAPIEWVGAEPLITLKALEALGIQAPHPNAAKLFIDFILSREGQEIMRDVDRIPARPDIEPKAARLTKGQKLYYSDHSLAEVYDETRREYDSIFVKKQP